VSFSSHGKKVYGSKLEQKVFLLAHYGKYVLSSRVINELPGTAATAATWRCKERRTHGWITRESEQPHDGKSKLNK